MNIVKMGILGVIALIVVVSIGFATSVAGRYYDVWAMDMEGKAVLAKAEQTRQVQIAQAHGELEASKLRAEAISVVGKAAKDFPEYRNQEFIGAFSEALKEGKIQQIMYVPTEANIPITEAGKRPNIKTE